MTRTPRHLIQAAKEHAIGREQDIFLAGAKYGHANKTISEAEFYRAEDAAWDHDDAGLSAVQCGGLIRAALDALGIGITVDRPDQCCGVCPPIAGGGYDCTCKDSPRCTKNKEDRK